ncbi:MAG TPA: LamG domain-containing protein, partial [Verrucomicrobiae bacterium]
MNDIKFSCPQCGQHLMVAASGANATVACPQCGQAIIVPSPARAARPESPKPRKWLWVAAGIVVVALFAAGVLIWQKHQRLATQTRRAPAKMSTKNVTAQPATPEQQAAKVKERWSKAFNDARQDFLNSNDRETADFCGNILVSLDQPGGSSPTALATQVERIKNQVRDLARRDALESAASLNWALWLVLNQPGSGSAGPANPNHKTGGTPGPGGLVLYLPFDKLDENGLIRDESGAGNDGHVFGAQWVSDGKFGGAYQFHITNITDRIVIPNSDALNPDNFTVTAWVKAADHDGFWNRILDKDWRSGYCLTLGGDHNGKANRGKLVFESGGGSVGTSRVLNDNQWHHMAGSYDGSVLRCYIDGTGPSPVKKSRPLKKSSWDLCVGNSVVDYGTGEFIAFEGLIDEVRIYNR